LIVLVDAAFLSIFRYSDISTYRPAAKRNDETPLRRNDKKGHIEKKSGCGEKIFQ